MKGAIVFLAVFFLLLLATIAYPSLPPGPQIYGALNVPSTDYPVLGIEATTLIVGIFNGVIYGVIAWLIYTIVAKTRKKTPSQAQPK